MKFHTFFFIALVASTSLLGSCGNATNPDSEATTIDTAAADTAMAGMDHDHMGANATVGSGMMGIMHSMMEKMEANKPAGNIDHDFAHMMLEHHKGAVDMSALELKEGKDATLQAMAKKISTDQQEEIRALEAIATRLDNAPANYKPNNPQDPFTAKMKASMDVMMKMPATTGNVDQDYALLMVPHHQSAVDMAKAELAHGRDTKLKEMAQQMIEDQEKEIKEFQAWQAKNGSTLKASTAVYVCPMGCEGSQSNKPGKCPTCGMDLEKKS